MASPAVRRLAAERGIDLARVQGSGPGGRIEKHDVLAPPEEAPEVGDLVSPHRQALARRLSRSATIPQFSLGVTVDITRAAALLEREREGEAPGLTYTHLLLRGIATALRAHPEMNVLWDDEGPRRRRLERADVGLAVAGEDALLVVTIPEPDRLSLPELVEQSDRAAAEARAGRVSERFSGPATVTLSNLGMVGVDRFIAVIDPDQTAILASGAVVKRPGEVAGGIGLVPQLELTLTSDHRAVDGVVAGRFLAEIQKVLEGGELSALAP
jgi:pyruvate dehydrogenase E2 component (dihydrolipoamide acetyltransferase)